MTAKYGDEASDLSCRRVQVGTETLPDGTVQPVFDIQPYVPEAYRRLIEFVTNDGHQFPRRR